MMIKITKRGGNLSAKAEAAEAAQLKAEQEEAHARLERECRAKMAAEARRKAVLRGRQSGIALQMGRNPTS
eukprot:COSAG01_NODE_3391_length_6151_cov_4.717944_7_plen_71_part_00